MSDRFCYYIPTTDAGEDIFPAIVKENEPGFYPTDWNWGKNMERAEKIASDMNEKLGLSRDDVAKIIASSIVAQSRRLAG